MSSVFTSVVRNSAALPPSPLRAEVARGSARRAGRGACGASGGAVRLGRAGEAHGRHRVCAAAVGQGSSTSGGKESGDQNSRSWSWSWSSGSKARRLEYDVVIVGAGIVGLATAHHILSKTNLSVALIDAEEPCAGATGAGQGYIWMSHRTPGSAGWALASRSKLLWEELVAEIEAAGVDPLKAMGWKNTGSVLVASTTEEAEALQQSVSAVLTAGVPAEYVSATDARKAEPALSPDHLAAAALFPDDAQIDANLTVALLLQRIKAFSPSRRYKELFQTRAHRFISYSAMYCG